MYKKELCKKLQNHGFKENIIHAFEVVKRENFIPQEKTYLAYEDMALPIGYGQTISQPFTIAFMLKLLEINQGQRILEVGSGSGYVLALINKIENNLEIHGTEIVKELYTESKNRLNNFKNIHIHYTPNKLGLPNKPQFNRILVSASANETPLELIDQLNDPGIMVCPIRESIFKISKKEGIIKKVEYPGFIFVPLIKN
jgi:protein-L-isoaspartate(D-aspartate) O-methyltransferase